MHVHLTAGLLVLLAVIAVVFLFVGWVVRDILATAPRLGGTIDFIPAAARGELDLNWEDPRPRVTLPSGLEATWVDRLGKVVPNDGSLRC